MNELKEKAKSIISNVDDKDLAMVCISVLAIIGMIVIKDAVASAAIVTGSITAIAALATGRKNGN